MLLKQGVADQLYEFAVNQPISRFDPTGLNSAECPKCGRSVDRKLIATKADVVSRFNSLGSWKKHVNCRPWKYPATSGLDLYRAVTGWDMGIITYPWDNYCGPGSGVSCGMPVDKCKDTVQVSGGCYNSWDVNYMLYGWINSLCGVSDIQMGIIIIGYKTLLKWERWDQALAFAKLGKDGMGTPPPAPDVYKQCTGCGHEVAEPHLASTWPHSDWWL